jgi:signal transduction histidine kinase/ActR/RegA family two-component response regulator
MEDADLPSVEVHGEAYLVRSANAPFCQLVGKELSQLLEVALSSLVTGGEVLVRELDRVAHERSNTAAPAGEKSPIPSRLFAVLWPPAKGVPAQRVVVQLSPSSHLNFNESLAQMNEALLVSGLREHERRLATEELNLRLAEEVASRKRAEALLQEANGRLESAKGIADQANKAKDMFIAALSHELRTPLTPVLVAAAVLCDDASLSPAVRDRLRMIERNVLLEARLIDDLLDITKITHGKLGLIPIACDAASLIGLALEMVRPEAEQKEITIERAFGAAHSGLFADPARFQQVIWNLLRNAIKFTPRGGKVSIRTQDEAGSFQDNWLKIEVSDTGVGIEPQAIEKIFEPFDQGTRAGDYRYGGMGLGLAIARSVVALHGGTIQGLSAGPGRGSTFVVRFPATREPPPSGLLDPMTSFSAALLPLSAVTVARTYRLLFVEDHAATLAALRALLERDGHQVMTASSVAEALLTAAQNTFDLVLSDLGLPDGSGIELMTILRDKYGLRGIALSGYGMEEDIRASRQAGFAAHLIKPISPNELRRAIANLPADPATRVVSGEGMP